MMDKRPDKRRPIRTGDYKPPIMGASPNAKRPAVKRESAARRIAFFALRDVSENGAYAGAALGKWLRSSSASPEDKRLATNLFYTTLENRIKIDYILGQFVKKMPDSPVPDVMRLAASQILFLSRIPDHAAVDEAIIQLRALRMEAFAPMANGALRNLVRARDVKSIEMPDRGEGLARALSIECSAVEPLAHRLVEAYGAEGAEKILSYRPDERWESVRPNFLRMRGGEFDAYLTRRGFKFREGAVPDCRELFGAGDITRDEGYKAGDFSVLGAGSMLAAYACEPRPGMTVIDACAAPGGKATLIGELMQGSGRVYAYDAHGHRVELIRKALDRLKLYNVRPAVVDSRAYRADREQTADVVLVDAPCSGLGVLSSKADIKLNFRDGEVAELAETQSALLRVCSRYVKLGGLLVYATCTLLPEENESQISAFLAANADFAPDLGDAWLPEALRPLYRGGMIQLLSHRDGGVEGFFICRLRRSGGRGR